MLLLDIEKAFDTVWHKGLIHKLDSINLPLYLSKLIQNYLSRRTFRVQINNNFSREQKIATGVPQGSILGPVLFSYYINDLPIDGSTETALFADDTAIYNASWNKKTAIKRIQFTLNIYLEYFNLWKIKINAAKTELIILSHKIKLKKTEKDLKIEVLGEIIEPKTTVKYLGVILDTKLRFQQQISKSCSKALQIKQLLYPLLKRGNNMSTKNKTLLYKSLIKPILLYAAPIWSNASKTNIKKILTFENKILRQISNAEPNESNVEIKKNLEILSIENDIHEQTLIFYNQRIKNHRILDNVGIYKKNNAPFVIKHKLPHSLLL